MFQMGKKREEKEEKKKKGKAVIFKIYFNSDCVINNIFRELFLAMSLDPVK